MIYTVSVNYFIDKGGDSVYTEPACSLWARLSPLLLYIKIQVEGEGVTKYNRDVQMKLVLAGLLVIGMVGVVLGTSYVIYLIFNSFGVSMAFWMSAGLIVAVWSLHPCRRAYAQLTKLGPQKTQRLDIVVNKEIRETLEMLAALLLLLGLIAWLINRISL